MNIYSIESDEFAVYGEILEGIDTSELCLVMKEIKMPDRGVLYRPEVNELESCAVFNDFRDLFFGGLEIQIGMCWGYNSVLNCLEYHRSSEIIVGSDDFILLLARRDELAANSLNTSKVKGFLVPSGSAVELYSSTLHYAPCHSVAMQGFRTAVILPKGTNTVQPSFSPDSIGQFHPSAINKWVLAHPESPEASGGAIIGLLGKNIDIGCNSLVYVE